jgi:hypothetical protein
VFFAGRDVELPTGLVFCEGYQATLITGFLDMDSLDDMTVSIPME